MAHVWHYACQGVDSIRSGKVRPRCQPAQRTALQTRLRARAWVESPRTVSAMSDTWLVASFEWHGEPKLLPSREAAQAAIARAQIDHFTQVTVRLPSGDRQTQPAGEIAQFRELLGEPPATEEQVAETEALAAGGAETATAPPDLPAEPQPAPAAPPPMGAPAAAPATNRTTLSSSERAAPAAPPPQRKAQQPWAMLIAAALGLGVLVLLVLLLSPSAETSLPSASSEASGASQAASADASQAAADAASEAAAVEPEASASSSDSADGNCQSKRDAFDRLLCDDPGLRSADARLRGSWNAARRRMSGAGERIEPLSAVRQRIAMCRNAACARQAFATETQRLDQLQPTPQAAASPSEVAVAAPRCAPRAATPRGNPGSWVTENDYPSRAMRAELTGTVAFQVTVGVDGRVTGCRITGSSGHSELDEATCRVVSRRARFTPASNEACQPTEGSYSSRVRWILPE